MNIESEHINAVNRTKSYHSICLRQYLEKRVETSCPELSTKQLDQLERHLVALVDPMLSPSCATIISHDILLDKLLGKGVFGASGSPDFEIFNHGGASG